MSTNDDLIRVLREDAEHALIGSYLRTRLREAADALAASAAREAALTEVLARCATGIDHLGEIARQWEPDHSSGSDRRNWVLAQVACVDARKLLAANPPNQQEPARREGDA